MTKFDAIREVDQKNLEVAIPSHAKLFILVIKMTRRRKWQLVSPSFKGSFNPAQI